MLIKDKTLLRRHARKLLLQSGQIHRILPLCPGQDLPHRVQQSGLSGKQIALLKPVLHTLPELQFHRLALFL